MSFSFDDLHPKLARAIADLGFDEPTPIQKKAIPPGLQGRDVLACAMTGSGKTAAFLLPILQRMLHNPPPGGRRVTRALILSPTRELAAQIVEHFNELARHTDLKAVAVYGGVGMKPQEQAFRAGVDVVVACPGRLLDHFQYPHAKLEGLEVLVLDEADRMLDMGFLPDIRRVLRHLPPVGQQLLFSATMPRPIVELSRELLDNPVRLDVERQSAPATGIEQAVYHVRGNLKTALLLGLIANDEIGNAIVFTRTKHRANRLAQALEKKGVSVDRIHGNRSQAARTRALAGFKNGSLQILVATDIAARGIDVEALSHVVNFDVPHMPEDYIHRVGRTARAEATGDAFTFVSPEEMNDLRAIERAVGRRLPRRELEGFDSSAQPGEALEIPIADRIAAIRTRKAEERSRAKAKAQRKPETQGQPGTPRKQGGQRQRGAQDQPAGQRPQGQRPQGQRPQGQRPQGEASSNPDGNRPRRRRRRRGAAPRAAQG